MTVWLIVLSLLFVVPRINPPSTAVNFRWGNIPLILSISIVVSFLYNYFMARKEMTISSSTRYIHDILYSKVFKNSVIIVCVALMILPFMVNLYHTKVLTLVFIYIIFSLGLNVVIGLTGMLCLGQAFFLGVGAYTYALLNTQFGVGFYSGLLAGAFTGAIAGLLFSVVTIRLRGDYLAIVTLGLSEIFRLFVTNMNFTGGPRGISGIAKPSLFTLNLDFFAQSRVLYFVSLGLVIISMFFVRRLEHSRFGRSWEALREDEIASSAMGVHVISVRIGVFSINGLLGGVAGVLFASSTSFINPNSFSILVSVTALCVVVLGGLGSMSGVVLDLLF